MRRVRWGIVVGLLAAASPARGDDAAQRDAQARFEEGLARVRSKDLEGALLSFEQAYTVMHKPAVVWNLALVEEKTNRAVEALAHFKEYLRVAPSADPDRPRCQKHIDGLNAATGHIDVAAPAGAAITVDGTRALGATPFTDPVDVAPGHHDVEARLGTMVKTLGVDALAGQTMQADFRGMGAPPVAAPGATAPQAEGGPPPGSEPPPPPPDTAQKQGTFFTPRVITAASLAGAAVIALGTGVGFAVAATSNQGTAQGYASQHPNACSSFAPIPDVCASWRGAVNGQNTDTTLSYVGYIAAGVFAAASVATYLLWPSEAKSTVSTWIMPTVSPAGVGLGAVGRF